MNKAKKKVVAKIPKPVDYSKPLKNDKYERFCQEYIIDNNKTQAAIRAKYSEKTAGSKGEQLLKIVDIKNRVAVLQAALSKKSGVSAEMVVEELKKVGFSNIKEFLDEGNSIKDLTELPDNVTAAVESVQTDTRHDSGDSDGYTEKTKIKCHSKLGALNDLGKHLGIFNEDNKQRVQPINVNITKSYSK